MQRAWLPTADPALQVNSAKKVRVTQTNWFDNANSLALGEGLQLANRHISVTPQNFSRRSTEITCPTRKHQALITRK